jgi:protein phosphatase
VVADGVGGRNAGEVASRIGCEAIVARVARGGDLAEGFAAAGDAIAQAVASGEGSSGMAATAVALHLEQQAFSIAWLGDCRAYLWDGKLRQLTRDHSLVETMLARGEITLEQAARHPRRNVILAALGGDLDDYTLGSNHGELGGTGFFLLCSDGLCDTLDNASICEILAAGTSVESTVGQLVEASVAQGCKDNVTVLLVGFEYTGAETTRYAHSVRTFDPDRGVTLDETRPLVSGSSKVRRIPIRAAEKENEAGPDEQEAPVDTTTLGRARAPGQHSNTEPGHGRKPAAARALLYWLLALGALALIGGGAFITLAPVG